jgi:hypothetical protein
MQFPALRKTGIFLFPGYINHSRLHSRIRIMLFDPEC